MTWKSTSTSTGGTNSSKASTLFGLDEDDKANILVYKYRSGSKSLEVSSQHDLCKALDSGKHARLSITQPWKSCMANRGRPLQTQTCPSYASPRSRFLEATAG